MCSGCVTFFTGTCCCLLYSINAWEPTRSAVGTYTCTDLVWPEVFTLCVKMWRPPAQLLPNLYYDQGLGVWVLASSCPPALEVS